VKDDFYSEHRKDRVHRRMNVECSFCGRKLVINPKSILAVFLAERLEVALMSEKHMSDCGKVLVNALMLPSA
jgi:hypothetical protein